MFKGRSFALETAHLVVILSVISPAALAQQPLWTAIDRAKGQTITVVRNDNRSQTGKLEQTTGDSLTINDHEHSSVISRDDVRQVYARPSRSRKRGAMWGLALGGGGGAIAGAAIVQPCSSNSFCIVSISRGEGAAVGAGAGAAIGSIVGALVGERRKKTLLYDSGSLVSGQ